MPLNVSFAVVQKCAMVVQDIVSSISILCAVIPRTLSYSFHPKHPLRLTYPFVAEFDKCNVCSKWLNHNTALYLCEMCNFCLDFNCAKLLPSLKIDCHHHLLTFFKDFIKEGEEGQDSYCKACGKHFGGGASVYSCVQCHFSLHLKCVAPSSATHKYHRHPFTMMELIKEDDSEKYYYDICENERNPKDPVYYCQSCTFITHIQYILDQDKDASGKVSFSSPPPMENKVLFVDEMEQNEGTNVIHTLSLFRPIIHRHQMYEVTEELKGENYCTGCRLVEDNIEIRNNNFEERLRKKAVLALLNIVGDSPRCRDIVLGHGALLPLLAQLNQHAELYMLRNATWILATFCKPSFDQVKLVLPTLARLIHSNDDEVVLTNACWALSYLSDGTNDKIQIVIEAGVCGRLVELLM
ncbi:hypothetical protein PVK06_041157 [Gossypium arboreum]|uniref:DC1 domain-containing protein n=1 Tax=Gossypium arboreum TaxID=29729 RepID=A0ABR0N819_GOSAR|nr:hypothetical protein PVK06_041157 [Gossypium arboreum]